MITAEDGKATGSDTNLTSMATIGNRVAARHASSSLARSMRAKPNPRPSTASKKVSAIVGVISSGGSG